MTACVVVGLVLGCLLILAVALLLGKRLARMHAYYPPADDVDPEEDSR